MDYLAQADPQTIEHLYSQYCQDPQSVDVSWQRFFEGFEFSGGGISSQKTTEHSADHSSNFQKESAVANLIGAYRQRGHLYSKTNPVRPRRVHEAPIKIENFGLSQEDLNATFQAGASIGLANGTLREVIDAMEKTYCGAIGVEIAHVRPSEASFWLRSEIEKTQNQPHFSKEQKKKLLQKLLQTSLFEKFLHTKFTGQKRFSLEGSESFIPALDDIIKIGAKSGVKEFVIGMAHRGRLNVLANIMSKSYVDIFAEFLGKSLDHTEFEGDVKYHLGYSADRTEEGGQKVHLHLAANPSHLEAINAVVLGMTRAKLDMRYAGDFGKIAPILVHGDAAIAGQGINYELIQMSGLAGYKIGGAVHVVLNNQVGFTTNYQEARSSVYCTDLAKATSSPVFHVNGDDPEAVAYSIQLALEYKQRFNRDVFVDILGYRRYGHNEGDEPRFTQPILYNLIGQHPDPLEIYSKRLIQNGSLSQAEFDKMYQDHWQHLEQCLEESKERDFVKTSSFLQGQWKQIRQTQVSDFDSSPQTGVAQETLFDVVKTITDVPEDFTFFPKLEKLFKTRQKMVLEQNKMDWAMAELCAYGTLLNEGKSVRLSGQDVCRGTFAHRHAVIKDPNDETTYIPLEKLVQPHGLFQIYNSNLSEYGVLGFDYGYSWSSPDCLTIWEAQFGDFANGAQIIIDQFISSAETKWQRMSGIVLSLPHGYEGQGPEHSSARIERFLILCASNNIQVTNCTTPANLFHAFRRQLIREFRKPLIQFSPKSLLRHPQCVSPIEDFLNDTNFQEVIDNQRVQAPQQIKRILFCSGKIYYDLEEFRQSQQIENIVIVRLEQLYPLPKKQIQNVLEKYHKAEVAWVQEEPENMGAWSFILRHTKDWLPLKCYARPASASPAVGTLKQHKQQHEDLIQKALTK